MKNTFKLHSRNYFLGFIQLILAFIVLTSAANAAIYVVTNTNDSGAGSLRQGILNGNGTSIHFNIPGSGVKTINLLSPLPNIGGRSIHGTTQPGYSGTPLIEINGANAGEGANGFTVGNGFGYIEGVIINRFSGYGVYAECFTDCNYYLAITVKNSYIGTNAAGTAALGNGNGIYIKSFIGKEDLDPEDHKSSILDNVISGNLGHGITIISNGNDSFPVWNDPVVHVLGNKIGTNAAGTAAVANGGDGVFIDEGNSPMDVKIGDATSQTRNIISGNAGNGIHILDGRVVIKGNFIGTNAAGNADLGNADDGIRLNNSQYSIINSLVDIGGTTTPERNVISGNNKNGIRMDGDSFTHIDGNYIGTNALATAPISNSENGIYITSRCAIGVNAGNVISGNVLNGIFISGSEADQSSIQRNYIGTNAGGTLDLGNGGDGVRIFGGAEKNQIGFISNDGTSAPNTIAFNGGDGISVPNSAFGGSPDGNAILANSIYSNDGLGIDLGASGVTSNDHGDGDTGANGLQNFPILGTASPTQVFGTLNSKPNKDYAINIFRTSSCDASGSGEGSVFLKNIVVTTDANGIANFNATGVSISAGQTITATATEKQNDQYIPHLSTSEFSPCIVAGASPPGDLKLSSAVYTANETNSNAFIIVTREGGTSGTVTVNYTTGNNTATAGQDYTATSGILTFANGESAKQILIPINNDASDEPDETVNITLSNPTGGANLINPSSAVLTIVDNDNPPTISIKHFSKAEGNSGTTPFTFDVSLSAASGFPVSVNWKTSSEFVTATAGVDYVSANGTLNFAAGETFKQITVLVNGDLIAEIDEAFRIELFGAVNASIAVHQAIGGITDDDNPGKLGFSAASYDVNENAGVKIVVVHRTDGTAGTVTVDYATTNNSTATANTDYMPASGTLTFLDGEQTKTFQVTILDDQTAEQTESINLVLSNQNGGATLSTSTTVINIADDDATATTSIEGTVTYAITPLNQSQKTVPGVVVSASGASNASDTTDSSGIYSIENLNSGGQYTVTAGKSGDISGITAFDATLVLRHVAAGGQGLNALSAVQQKAADTDSDNSVTAFDATQILRFVAANGATVGTGQTGNWQFLPATKNYQSLGNSLSGENYEGFLIGEVSGDWLSSSVGPVSEMENEAENISTVKETEITKKDDSNADVEISLPVELSAASEGEILVVPVLLTDYAGRSFSAYSFDLQFDPNVLQPDAERAIETTETLSEGLTVVTGISKSGRIGIAAAGSRNEISNNNSARNGVLVNLRFKIIGTPREKSGGETALTFRRAPVFQDNEGGVLKIKRTDGAIRDAAGKMIAAKRQ